MISKKYFSLIYGNTIKQAPQSKIIPAEDVSKLLTGQEVLTHIVEDVEKYRHEVAAECEELKAQAIKDGFAQGYEEWTKQLAAMEGEIGKVQGEMQKLVMPIALKAAKKIVAAELALQPAAILEIVSNALKSVSQHKRIVIYVNRADLQVLEKNKNKIKDLFESLESLSIRERDDVEQGGCIIETEGGIINARLKDRWRNLEAAFESLADTMRKPTT
ncbi:MAG: HrpE/YscL family type III secretion apparatus protein [Chlamydiales bacterium]|nr:HrpE/YscL family type III secretion apparatus protein [Chlamydiales bacterium]